MRISPCCSRAALEYLRAALKTDHHFEQAGFRVLLD
jgi:hypothetical protein